MDSFANRYLYLPPKSWLAGKQSLLWPVYAWKVLYPAEDQRLGANVFQEAILGLMRTGMRDPLEIAKLLVLHPELVRFIIATQLQPNGWLNEEFKLTQEAIKVLDDAEDSRMQLRVGYAFQDAISGIWLPRFLAELPEIVPIGHNSKDRPEFLLDKGRGRSETPFILSPGTAAQSDIPRLTEAYRIYRKDLAAAQRNDRSLGSGLQVQAIEALGDQPTCMYLWCELYRDEGESQPWLVSDPFRIRRAASWLRKPLLELAPHNQNLIRKMQKLVEVPADACSAEEWLRRVEEGVELELWGDYRFLDQQDLIREHLGSVLRQKKKIEGRQSVNREELATLLGEAHNLLEAVLKWLLLKWPVDTRSWPRKKLWTRDEAKSDFNSLGLPCISSDLVNQLAGQRFGEITKAIQYQDRPLKALLGGALYCAAEHADHPFRGLDATALDLERLPALADFRNKVSGHASGKKATLIEVLDSTNFAIQWMALFHDRY